MLKLIPINELLSRIFFDVLLIMYALVDAGYETLNRSVRTENGKKSNDQN